MNKWELGKARRNGLAIVDAAIRAGVGGKPEYTALNGSVFRVQIPQENADSFEFALDKEGFVILFRVRVARFILFTIARPLFRAALYLGDKPMTQAPIEYTRYDKELVKSDIEDVLKRFPKLSTYVTYEVSFDDGQSWVLIRNRCFFPDGEKEFYNAPAVLSGSNTIDHYTFEI